MKTAFQTLLFESYEILFIFDRMNQPIIEIEGIQYSSLSSLLQAIPQLASHQYRVKLAQIVNFLAKGMEFQYIEDIEKFRENYFRQIEVEQSNLIDQTHQLKDYGIFDVSVMHSARFIDHQLVFFVRHDFLSIPYKVTLFSPFQADLSSISYELLPYIN